MYMRNKGILIRKMSGAVLCILLLAPAALNAQEKMPITTSSEEARELFIEGRDQAEKLNISKSIDLLDRAIELDPESDSIKTFIYDFPSDQLLKWSAWRTDFYICTGIAFAKENGFTVQDFAKFGAKTHTYTWNSIRGKGIDPIAQALIRFWKSYQSSDPEILNKSDSSITIRFEKPYKNFFYDGHLLGVSISEFETYLFGHIRLILNNIEMEFDYTIEDKYVDAIIKESSIH